jgi:peptidoglycan/xylan/chitin deacetylase (PgdA/CDA1 family)
MYTAKTPGIARWLVRDALWRMPASTQTLYLTFDDGPTPDITDQTLDLLAAHNAKATFFLIGRNAVEHPHLVERMVREGHTIGNHTWSHVNAWKVKGEDYLNDTFRCQEALAQLPSGAPQMFRPPYGKLTYRLYHELRLQYRLVLWDVLSADFDLTLPHEQVWANVRDHAEAGSVIVFHDSVKCAPRMVPALQRTLEEFGEKGFGFEGLGEGRP